MVVYFTADLHLGHKNIIRHCERPFGSAEQMDQRLIASINAVVGQHDTLYILGDFAGPQISRDEAIAYRGRIACKHVHLVQGNHDKDFRDADCFESVAYYRKVKLGGRKVILFHYPIAEWDGKWHGTVHLHGHSHNRPEYNQHSLEQGLLRFDVGVDANDYAPISERAILELVRETDVAKHNPTMSLAECNHALNKRTFGR